MIAPTAGDFCAAKVVRAFERADHVDARSACRRAAAATSAGRRFRSCDRWCDRCRPVCRAPARSATRARSARPSRTRRSRDSRSPKSPRPSGRVKRCVTRNASLCGGMRSAVGSSARLKSGCSGSSRTSGSDACAGCAARAQDRQRGRRIGWRLCLCDGWRGAQGRPEQHHENGGTSRVDRTRLYAMSVTAAACSQSECRPASGKPPAKTGQTHVSLRRG